MILIDTRDNKKTTAVVELQKPIGSLLFSSSLSIDELAKETINIRVVRPNKGESILIHSEDVSLASFLLASTLTGNPIGANKKQGFNTQCVVPLTIGGNVPLSDNDNIRIELKGLDSKHNYLLQGIQASYNSTHAMTYTKKNAPKDNTSIDFPVQGYDLAVLELTDDLVSVDVRHSNGFLATMSIDELVALMSQTFGVAQINSDGICLQQFDKFVQIPLAGISVLSFKKDTATTVTTLLLRNNLLN